MRSSDLLVEFYEPEDDSLGVRDFDDRRRPRLTLRSLTKMRKMKDAEIVDRQDYLERLPEIYAVEEESSM